MLIRWIVDTGFPDENGVVQRRKGGDEDFIPDVDARSFITAGMAVEVIASLEGRKLMEVSDEPAIPDSSEEDAEGYALS